MLGRIQKAMRESMHLSVLIWGLALWAITSFVAAAAMREWEDPSALFKGLASVQMIVFFALWGYVFSFGHQMFLDQKPLFLRLGKELFARLMKAVLFLISLAVLSTATFYLIPSPFLQAYLENPMDPSAGTAALVVGGIWFCLIFMMSTVSMMVFMDTLDFLTPFKWVTIFKTFFKNFTRFALMLIGMILIGCITLAALMVARWVLILVPPVYAAFLDIVFVYTILVYTGFMALAYRSMKDSAK